MNPATLLLVTALAIPTNVLVLRSGDRIEIQSAHEQDGRMVFRTTDGGLYSLSLQEIDLVATRTGDAVVAAVPVTGHGQTTVEQKKLKVGADDRKRLLAELEQNHSGRPGPPLAIEGLPSPPSIEEVARRPKTNGRGAVARVRRKRSCGRQKRTAICCRIEPTLCDHTF
jgi:hypothetical protein